MRALAALTRQRVSRSLDPLAVRDGRDLLLRLLKVHVGRNRRGGASHETVARRQTALRARIQHSVVLSGDRRFTWNGPYLPLEDDPMSKPVNDVRASSFKRQYEKRRALDLAYIAGWKAGKGVES